MQTARPSLLDLARQRLSWADQRQALLARNVANANTPGYQPTDLEPFQRALVGAGALAPVQTQSSHLAGATGAGFPTALVRPALHAPDGNAVSLDRQLTDIADTENAQAITTTIYKKYLAMFSVALGRPQ